MENADKQYGYVDNMVKLYKRLQDEQSKDFFWARLQFELEPNMDTAVRFNEIVMQYQNPGSQAYKNTWREEFAKVSSEGKKLILYGAGVNGQTYANLIWNSHEDFYAFCDQDKSGEIILGKPVFSPAEILADPMLYAIVISTGAYYREVLHFLQKNNFPMDSILHCFDFFDQNAYFIFPDLLKPGTGFVDAGCYDGTDSIRFCKWCNGDYSKIFAFEPDEANFHLCKEGIETARIRDVVLYKAGLSDVSGEASFAASATTGSYLLSTGHITANIMRMQNEISKIHTIALDDIADVEIGMIKMDIEGAEFDALRGAKQVIQQDKPLLAICIYHRQGDMLAIMDYLHSLVPEYRFWIRHHGRLAGDTVLYAAI